MEGGKALCFILKRRTEGVKSGGIQPAPHTPGMKMHWAAKAHL